MQSTGKEAIGIGQLCNTVWECGIWRTGIVVNPKSILRKARVCEHWDFCNEGRVDVHVQGETMAKLRLCIDLSALCIEMSI